MPLTATSRRGRGLEVGPPWRRTGCCGGVGSPAETVEYRSQSPRLRRRRPEVAPRAAQHQGVHEHHMLKRDRARVGDVMVQVAEEPRTTTGGSAVLVTVIPGTSTRLSSPCSRRRRWALHRSGGGVDETVDDVVHRQVKVREAPTASENGVETAQFGDCESVTVTLDSGALPRLVTVIVKCAVPPTATVCWSRCRRPTCRCRSPRPAPRGRRTAGSSRRTRWTADRHRRGPGGRGQVALGHIDAAVDPGRVAAGPGERRRAGRDTGEEVVGLTEGTGSAAAEPGPRWRTSWPSRRRGPCRPRSPR